MNIRCWQCSEDIDASSVEKQVYQSLIEHLRGKLCEGSINDDCGAYRHEDCFTYSILIQELKDKL